MREEKQMATRKSNRNYIAIIGVVIVVVVVIAAVALLFLQENKGDEAKVTDNVKDAFALLTESNVEVLSSKYENGIYKIVLRITDAQGNSKIQDVFATKDGMYMTDRLVDLEAYRLNLAKEKDFINCLFNKGVRVVGISNNTASVLQVQALGNFGYKLYFDCSGENLQVCQNVGVQSVPSVIYNNTIYEGLKTADWFVTMTGCTI